MLNDPIGSGDIVTGWGGYDNFLAGLGYVEDPPTTPNAFIGGAGGGESEFFAKPSWQKSLPGTGREVPDVSAVADPLTGVPVVVSSSAGTDVYMEVGGTSLATPVFSAIWAIADEYNGKNLGLAAPAVARLKQGQITDVLPTSDLTPFDLSGLVIDQNGSTYYSPDSFFANAYPSIAQTQYLTAASPLGVLHNVFDLTFGADTSLTVTEGYDNVTGYGEPNGLPFIQGVTGRTQGAAVAK